MPREVSHPTIPCLPGLPLIGNLLAFRQNRLALLQRVSQEYGDIGALHGRLRPWVMLNSSEFVSEVLVSHLYDFEKTPSMRVFASQFLGNGLLTSKNEFHKQERKLIAPAFRYQRIASYTESIINYTNQLLLRWKEGEVIDIVHEMMSLTLRIIGKALFNVDLLDEAKELGEAFTKVIHLFNLEATSIIHVPYTWPTPRKIYLHNLFKQISTRISQIIEERSQVLEDQGDILSMLLRARSEDNGIIMTDRQVLDECLTLFLAGYETTADALIWCWYLLSLHPKIYSKMQEEVDSILGEHVPNSSDLPHLPYTLQVFKESMRLYPPGYFIGRQAERSIDNIRGYYISAGTIVFISPYTIHRRPQYFPDPDRFDPRRFTPEAEQHLSRYAYLPFGAGSRICIGNQFALMEGHLILARLAQLVTFELVSGQHIEPEPLITLRPKNEIKMIVKRRKETTNFTHA